MNRKSTPRVIAVLFGLLLWLSPLSLVSAQPLFKEEGPETCLHGSRNGKDMIFIVRWETNEGEQANKKQALSPSFGNKLKTDYSMRGFKKLTEKQTSALRLPEDREFVAYSGNPANDNLFGLGSWVVLATYSESSVYVFLFPIDLDGAPVKHVLTGTILDDDFSDSPQGWVGCF